MAKLKLKSKQLDDRAGFLTKSLYCFSFTYKQSCYHIHMFQGGRKRHMLSIKSHGENNIGSGKKNRVGAEHIKTTISREQKQYHM